MDYGDRHSGRARVFISCGQNKNSDEVTTAGAIASRLQTEGFDTYVAVEQQTLRGLKENVFAQLDDSEYFVFVDFKREKLVGARGVGSTQHRGSLFSHQELAVASYLGVPLLAFQEKGIKKNDGILGFIQANATPFTDRNTLANVVADEVRRREWNPRSKNELVIHCPAEGKEFLQLGAERFFYLDVQNRNHYKTARNCFAYLEKAVKRGTEPVEVPFESIELKWAGYVLPNANILPYRARRFDAFKISQAEPTKLRFSVFSDAPTLFNPSICQPGEYELCFTVVSDNFRIARATFLLNLSDTLGRSRLTRLSVA